jgi:hypothetical protein
MECYKALYKKKIVVQFNIRKFMFKESLGYLELFSLAKYVL